MENTTLPQSRTPNTKDSDGIALADYKKDDSWRYCSGFSEKQIFDLTDIDPDDVIFVSKITKVDVPLRNYPPWEPSRYSTDTIGRVRLRVNNAYYRQSPTPTCEETDPPQEYSRAGTVELMQGSGRTKKFEIWKKSGESEILVWYRSKQTGEIFPCLQAFATYCGFQFM